MKRINIFKSRLDTLDRNPVLRKILEKESCEDSGGDEQEEENKKKENNAQNEEFVYYSFRKKMQMEYQKKLKEKQAKKEKREAEGIQAQPKSGGPEVHKKKDVFSRLMKNDNDVTEKSTIKVDENLQIRFETGKKLYHDLSKAKNEKEYRKKAREHW